MKNVLYLKRKVKLDLNNKLQQLMQKNKIRFKIHFFEFEFGARLSIWESIPIKVILISEAESLIRKAIKRSTYKVTNSLKPDAVLDLFEDRAVFGANTSADDILVSQYMNMSVSVIV